MSKWGTFFCLIAVLFTSSLAFAADKVVVIPMSSSSISRQQTYMYDRSALRVSGLGGAYIHYFHGCANNSENGSTSFVPLTLPLGARIVSLFVDVYDGISTASYNLNLTRHSIIDGALWSSVVISTQGGSGTAPGVVKKLLTPKITEIVEENESFMLVFNTADNLANAFCSAQITLELP